MISACVRATVVLLATLAGGCVVHRGGFTPAPATPSAAGPRLYVVGGALSDDRHAAVVAEGLDRALASDLEAGATPVVLWLGELATDDEHPKRCQRAGPSPVTRVLERRVREGVPVLPTRGPADRRCSLLPEQPAWPPANAHYVARIGKDGSVTVVSRCDDASCTIDPAPDAAQVWLDLVIVDVTPFVAPPPADTPAAADAHRDLLALEHLLAALARSPPGAPRVLASTLPVESPGIHGFGGVRGDATLANLPPALREAIGTGTFAGALGGQEHLLSADADITRAIKRSDRVALPAAFFQVVSGAASAPDARAASGYRRIRRNRGNTYVPALATDHPGFVVLADATEASALVVAHAVRRGEWETAALRVSLRPNPVGAESQWPVMTPCARCPAIPATDR